MKWSTRRQRHRLIFVFHFTKKAWEIDIFIAAKGCLHYLHDKICLTRGNPTMPEAVGYHGSDKGHINPFRKGILSGSCALGAFHRSFTMESRANYACTCRRDSLHHLSVYVHIHQVRFLPKIGPQWGFKAVILHLERIKGVCEEGFVHFGCALNWDWYFSVIITSRRCNGDADGARGKVC